MNVTVTGGHGFLGNHVCRELMDRGHKPFTSHALLHDLTNMTQTQEMLASHWPDAVIHLAARVGGIGANKNNPGLFAYQNLAMGLNIIEACRIFNIKKLVIAGTICAYPKFTPVPFKEENLWSGYPEETNAPYGTAKKMLLVLAQGYRQQYGCNFTYLLPVNLYGPHDNFNLETSHVIPAMMAKFHYAAKNNASSVTLWGDGSPTREFLYVEDCAKAFVDALERYDGPEPVNVGSGKEISMKDLASKIKDLVGYKGEIHWDTSKPNGQPRRCLDTSKAKKLFGWQAETSFDEGLAKTYEWFVATRRE